MRSRNIECIARRRSYSQAACRLLTWCICYSAVSVAGEGRSRSLTSSNGPSDTPRSPRTIRDIFLPNDTLDCQSWSGSDLPPRSLLQSCNPFSPAPGRGESVKLFSFGDRAVELKQAAISDILTDVIISRPIQKARGLYSFGLPLASKEYFTAIIEKVNKTHREQLRRH